MLDREYAQMHALEKRLWWYRGLHLFVTKLLAPRAKEGLRVLDIGCGTGGLMDTMRQLGLQATGLDFSITGLHFAAQRENGDLLAGDANQLPLAGHFDLVTSVNLLETDSVDPERVIAEAVRVLRPGGYGLFIMAAHQWLLSEHDRAVHSVRRYRPDQLRQLVARPGLSLVRSSYLFLLTLPLFVIRKLLTPPKADHETPVSAVTEAPGWVNAILYSLCWLEAQWLARFGLPMGSSAMVLVRKDD